MMVTRRVALERVAAAIGLPWTVSSMERVSGTGDQGALVFEVYRDARRKFRWRLKAANGRIMASSHEGYNNKADCLKAIDRIRESAATAEVDDKT